MGFRKLLLCGVTAGTLPISAHAAIVSVEYTAILGFNPEEVLGTGGQVTEDFIDELFGPGIGSTGTAEVTGRFEYDSDTPSVDGNNAARGFFDGITFAEVILGDQTVTADFDAISANDESSGFGFFSDPNGSFCTGANACDFFGLPHIPDGNRIATANNTDFTVVGPEGDIPFDKRDSIALGVGDTAAEADFTPLLNIPQFGDVFVNSAQLFVVSDESASVFNSLALPESDSFLFDDGVEFADLTITFDGPGLPDGFFLSGEAAVSATMMPDGVIPVPAAFPLLLGGIASLGLLSRRRKVP